MIRTGQMFEDAKRAFGVTGKIEHKDAVEIMAEVSQKLSEVNCVRIIIGSPVLLFFPIFNIFSILLTVHQNTFLTSFIASVLLVIHILAYDIASVKILYGEGKNERRVIWFRHISHRIFWVLWTLFMLAISYCRVLEKRGGLFVILTWVIVSVVPLYRMREFFFVLFLLLVAGNSGFALLFYSAEMTTYIFYSTAAMVCIGFVCQYFQVRSWMMQQYIQLKAFKDPLTGLLNRRGANVMLAEYLKWHKDSFVSGVIMLDIDFFKKYNDSLGHDAGDDCLRTVSDCIREASVARTPLAIRHGGEEFVVLVPKASEEEIIELAEKIRTRVYARALEAPYKEVAEVVTVSVGASMAELQQGISYEEYLKNADEALYMAKKNGRNQVRFLARSIEG